jgi:hypothetical protein
MEFDILIRWKRLEEPFDDSIINLMRITLGSGPKKLRPVKHFRNY